MKPSDETLSFEPTLALIERRLATRHQEKTFRPTDPLWVLFTNAELAAMAGAAMPEDKP